MKKALITGIAGQDGSYLAEFLLGKGYEVHGIIRKYSAEDKKLKLSRINHMLDKLILHEATFDDSINIYKILGSVNPDECYHLAAQSAVSNSFNYEFATLSTNIGSTHDFLVAIKELCKSCKFYFAASSEMYGNSKSAIQNEDTPFSPRSPYGISKTTGYYLTKYYRETYGMFALSGILFNHESPRRGIEFVTRKITNSVAKIKLGLEKELKLGNIDVKRDWGYAPEYVQTMWLMLNQEKPNDYVISTGISHSIKDFLETAFSYVDLDWNKYVKIDPKFFRPSEIFEVKGDSSKAKIDFGWEPKTSFSEIVKIMVDEDIKLLKQR